jgi:Skp family chaperone for outer membrane proteins
MRIGTTVVVAFLSLLVALAGCAWGAADVVEGQPAPFTGVLLGEEPAQRLVEELRDGRTAKSVAETQRAALEAKDSEIAELRKALEALRAQASAQAIALAVAEDRDKRRQEGQDQLLKALELADKALARAEKALDRSDKRIESLETRMFWQSVLGVLGPIGIGIAALVAM